MKSSVLYKEFLALISRYVDGTATLADQELAERYFALFSDAPEVLEQLDEADVQNIGDRMRSGIRERIRKQEKQTVVLFPEYLYPAAAILLVLFVGLYYQFHNATGTLKEHSKQRIVLLNDIAPGSNKAILTLANGSKISLDDATQGEIAREHGITIIKDGKGKLKYKNFSNAGAALYNKIETPVGGQYQVVLPDGTKVWLNAASSLNYPLTFNGKSRSVALTGEAYFEVAKDQSRPFKVHSAAQEIVVLGTHFNVNAYTNENEVKTTLITGSVAVRSLESGETVRIKPGQQSRIINHIHSGRERIELENVDTDLAMAWKQGYFMYDKQPLEEIMKELSRWYEIEQVEYLLPDLSKRRFSGTISRYANASQVLKKLELTGAVHFRISGRRIIVMK